MPLARLFAYLDDIVIVVPRAAADFALSAVRAALATLCGMELAVDKTQVWSPTPEPPIGPLAAYWRPAGLVILGGPMEAPCIHTGLIEANHNTWPRAGAMAFGCPAGKCVQGLVDARLRLMDDAAGLVTQLLGHAPPDYPAAHVALLLLVHCIAPKADHLLRHLPPASSASFAPRVDRLLLETFQAILGARLSARQAEQLQFPLSEGGVGLLARSGAFAAAAYIGSWALVYHRVAAATGWSLPVNSAGVRPNSTAYHLHSAVVTAHAAGANGAGHLLDPSWWEAAKHEPVAHVQRSLAK